MENSAEGVGADLMGKEAAISRMADVLGAMVTANSHGARYVVMFSPAPGVYEQISIDRGTHLADVEGEVRRQVDAVNDKLGLRL